MKDKFTGEEKLLLNILSLFFHTLPGHTSEEEVLLLIQKAEEQGDIEWDVFFTVCGKHGVTAPVYHMLLQAEEQMEESIADRLKLSPQLQSQIIYKTDAVVLQNYHLLFLGRTLIQTLNEAGIQVVVLKGSCTAAYYPVPELRKTGDLDLLLLNQDMLPKAEEILRQAGLTRDPVQHANHHAAYTTKEGIEIELHVMLTEPFDNQRMNHYLEQVHASCKEHIIELDSMGVRIPSLDNGYHAYYLLLHMLQHFLRSGFGIKLFCDWTAFWREEKGQETERIFLRLAEESGVLNFARTVTAVCVGWLGLDAAMVRFLFGKELTPQEAKDMGRSMIREALEAEEFGRSSADRMVIVRGEGVFAYIREFHHQMHLNFPNCGKCVLLWPVLWVCTLIQFLENNRKLRKVSTWAIMKKARKRSRLIRNLDLFTPSDGSDTDTIHPADKRNANHS